MDKDCCDEFHTFIFITYCSHANHRVIKGTESNRLDIQQAQVNKKSTQNSVDKCKEK
jgi:hypothetical protein